MPSPTIKIGDKVWLVSDGKRVAEVAVTHVWSDTEVSVVFSGGHLSVKVGKQASGLCVEPAGERGSSSRLTGGRSGKPDASTRSDRRIPFFYR